MNFLKADKKYVHVLADMATVLAVTNPNENELYVAELEGTIYYWDGIGFVEASSAVTVSGDSLTTEVTKANGDFKVKVKDQGISTNKIADGAVTTVKIQNLGVNVSKLAVDSVTTEKIVNNNVTNAKLVNVPAKTLKGNDTGSTGVVKDLTVTEVINMLGLTSSLYYKGNKTSFSQLPSTGNKIGDVWNVTDTGFNYIWNGTDWDQVSGLTDLSNYDTAAVASTKYVKTKSESNKLYGTDPSKADVTYSIGTLANQIPQRTTGGDIIVPAFPGSSVSAASKQYVDSLKTSFIVLDFTDDLEIVIYTPVDLIMEAPVKIVGATPFNVDILVNNNPYSPGDAIAADSKIQFVSALGNVCKIQTTKS